MQQLKICVIDEPLDPYTLNDLIPNCPPVFIEQNNIRQEQRTSTPHIRQITHGTLCTAVLIEFLQRIEIIEQVQVFHFSVGYGHIHNTNNIFISGIEFCKKEQIDLVSCSIGMFQHIWAKPIIPLLQGLKKTLIIAAAANNGHITYPAALPSVLGVKVSKTPLTIPFLYAKTPDGIDLVASCSKSTVLEKTGYSSSNSFLAPQVCAQVAKLVLQGIPIEKESVLLALGKGHCVTIEKELPFFEHTNPDGEPPVILIPYSKANFSERLSIALQLQERFEENDYGCGVLCDRFTLPDFEAGVFPVDSQNIEKDISYYVNVAENSLFLLVAEQAVFYDLTISEQWLEEQSSNVIQSLFDKILKAFTGSSE